MAPTLTPRQDMLIGSTEDTSSTDSSVAPWLVPVILVAAMGLIFIFIYVITGLFRSKQYEEACKKDPYLTRKEFRRRRKMNAMERLEEEELQRSFMIRKSLATRSSRASSQASQVSITFYDPEEVEMAEEVPNRSLRDDWKEWEARLQRERSNSEDRHPSISSPLASELPMPPESRTAVSDRSPLQSARGSPPLPSLPSSARLNEPLGTQLTYEDSRPGQRMILRWNGE